MLRRYGIDLGGVIIGGGDTDNDTSFFSEHFLRTPAVSGSFDGVRHLVDQVGPRNVFIISKAGSLTRIRSLEWLKQPFEELDGKNFYQHTGALCSSDHMWFCRQRRDKAPIAASLGITDFIDDKAEVLRYMKSDVPYRILFGPQERPIPIGVIHLPSWHEAELLP